MSPISNADLISRCNLQIKADAVEIQRLRKAADATARSARTAAVVSQAARDATPIGYRGEGRLGVFDAGLALNMLKAKGVSGEHLYRANLAKAAKKPATEGNAMHDLLGSQIDALKAHGLGDEHPAVSALKYAQSAYQDPNADAADPGEAAEMDDVAKAALVLGARALAKAAAPADDHRGRFGQINPRQSGGTSRQVAGGFEQSGS